MKKYRVSKYPSKIEEVEILRETDKCVFIGNKWRGAKEEREAKHSEFHRYFDSWELAHAHLSERANELLISARGELQQAQAFAGKVKGMKPPKANDHP